VPVGHLGAPQEPLGRISHKEKQATVVVVVVVVVVAGRSIAARRVVVRVESVSRVRRRRKT
jgi:hypothetical protein